MLLASRFEYKYVIHPEMVPTLRDYMQPYVKPDVNGLPWPEYRYPIISLYMDSPDLLLHRMTLQGAKNRYKLRIRGYTPNPKDPIFFEIKRRVNAIMLKTRAKLDRATAWDLLRGRNDALYSLKGPTRENVDKFLRHAEMIQAEPMCYVCYEREAYESIDGDPVRITFDSNLAYGMMNGETLAFDNPEKYPVPMDGLASFAGAVLEVKFTTVFPRWLQRMIETFSLNRSSFAKYVRCMEQAMINGHFAPGAGQAAIDGLRAMQYYD